MPDLDGLLILGTILLIALATGVLVTALEQFESRSALRGKLWTGLSGFLGPCVVISAVTVAISLPTLNSYFVGDDFGHIRLFHSMSFGEWLRLFHSDFSQGIWGYAAQELRPVIGLSWIVNYWLSGLHPLGYHLGSVLLHILSALLVFLIVKNLAPQESWRAAFAGLLFAVLPLHSEAISWTSGSRADALPGLLYLATFLSFVRYRSTERAGYLLLAIAAFVACLFSKEIAVTLPVMLASYDLLLRLQGSQDPGDGAIPAPKTNWRRLLIAYIPFLLILLTYLALRRFAFTSFLKEDYWQLGPHVQEAVASVPGFLQKVRGFGRIVWSLQAYNADLLFLPFGRIEGGILIGFLLAWSAAFLRQWPAVRRSGILIGYFGVAWYLIANTPLVMVYRSPRHFYLPAAGVCIAVSFLAVPDWQPNAVRRVRFLCAVLLICISSFSLRRQNEYWIRAGETSARLKPAFTAAIESVPEGSLVIASVPDKMLAGPIRSEVFVWSWALPFALQEPFTPRDLYAHARIVEMPGLYCCSDQWWAKTRHILIEKLSGPSEETVEIYLLRWDERSSTLRNMSRAVPRGVLRARVTQELGMPLETVPALNEAAGRRFVESLVRFLAEEGAEQTIP